MTFSNVSQHSVASRALSEGMNTFRSMRECLDNSPANEVFHLSQLPFPLSGSKASLLLNKCWFVVVIIWWWVLTPSAPGLLLCRYEVSPPGIQNASFSSPSFGGGLQTSSAKHPAAFANEWLFELLSLNIPVSHRREETFEFVLQLSIMWLSQ